MAPPAGKLALFCTNREPGAQFRGLSRYGRKTADVDGEGTDRDGVFAAEDQQFGEGGEVTPGVEGCVCVGSAVGGGCVVGDSPGQAGCFVGWEVGGGGLSGGVVVVACAGEGEYVECVEGVAECGGAEVSEDGWDCSSGV